MKDVKLVIDGREFPVSCLLLSTLAYRLPDDCNYNDLAKALVDLGIPSITSGVIRSIKLDRNTMDSIWDGGDMDHRRDLIKKNEFLKMLTDKQAEDIIEDNDPEILQQVASFAELLFPDNNADEKTEISDKTRKKLLDHIASHKDRAIRNTLWENSEIPMEYVPSFAQYVENRLMPTYGAMRISSRDLPLLKKCDRQMLETIAENIDVIEDKVARLKVCEYIVDLPDPYIRYTLASNSFAPEKILKKLMDDEDRDIARMAEESIKNSPDNV